ncbi:MAG: DinB family protein [Gemmatimonadetes bacterium]|nr:DinB family protein [Gemmatimonadota bacterium]
MQLRPTLIAISNDARSWLKGWAGDFTEDEATDSKVSPAHPLAWQLGHLACAEDDVYQLFSGQPGIVPDVLRSVCGTGCPAPTAATRYPLLSELWTLVDRTHANLLSLVERASDADFDRPPHQESRFFKSLGQAIYELALHENYHVGEIGTLRKAWGKKKLG